MSGGPRVAGRRLENGNLASGLRQQPRSHRGRGWFNYGGLEGHGRCATDRESSCEYNVGRPDDRRSTRGRVFNERVTGLTELMTAERHRTS